ncbi:MAG: hypothetical protein ACI884_001868, partial [Ulvibacter sp.]
VNEIDLVVWLLVTILLFNSCLAKIINPLEIFSLKSIIIPFLLLIFHIASATTQQLVGALLLE